MRQIENLTWEQLPIDGGQIVQVHYAIADDGATLVQRNFDGSDRSTSYTVGDIDYYSESEGSYEPQNGILPQLDGDTEEISPRAARKLIKGLASEMDRETLRLSYVLRSLDDKAGIRKELWEDMIRAAWKPSYHKAPPIQIHPGILLEAAGLAGATVGAHVSDSAQGRSGYWLLCEGRSVMAWERPDWPTDDDAINEAADTILDLLAE